MGRHQQGFRDWLGCGHRVRKRTWIHPLSQSVDADLMHRCQPAFQPASVNRFDENDILIKLAISEDEAKCPSCVVKEGFFWYRFGDGLKIRIYFQVADFQLIWYSEPRHPMILPQAFRTIHQFQNIRET